ncbi:MAG: transketolase [Polyangiaceae bacterium]
MKTRATDDLGELRVRAGRVRRDVIRLSYAAKTGHIGSSLSCAELIAALFFRFLRLDPRDPNWPGRDRFLMSKGHACVPLYSCLAQLGHLPEDVLEAYGGEGGPLGHHPKKSPEFGIEFGTGSLGHGLSVGCGLAFGAKLSGQPWRTAVLMSDGEQGEGTVWEAAAFAAHHRLDNVLAVVDFNKMQALGVTSDILGLEPLDARWSSFGWAVRRVDGHDIKAIVGALDAFPFEPGKPSIIVADTVKGKGVSFMEDSLLWHYRCPDAEEYAAAMTELGDA